jgi:hypothetical protein
MPSTYGPKRQVRGEQPGLDNLDAIERALEQRQRSESERPPSIGPPSFPVKGEATLPGLRAKVSVHPQQLRTFLVTAFAAASLVGIPTWFLTQWAALRAGHREIEAARADVRVMSDQLTTVQAVLKSHDRRIRACEIAAPMVVNGR